MNKGRGGSGIYKATGYKHVPARIFHVNYAILTAIRSNRVPEKAKQHYLGGDKSKADRRRDCERQRRARSEGKRYYDTARWKRLRRMVLARDPLCVVCLGFGRTEPATFVDHKTPLAAGGTNSPENLQGMCQSCHSRKTALHDGGFGHKPAMVNDDEASPE